MKIKQTPLASAIALAFAGSVMNAQAQQAPAVQETVVVTGIRASLEKSLDTKRNADTLTEVVTAEDIGKMPDKNIADAVQRLPGVTISSQSGGSGGFDENDRVSLRGTNPSLTQTLINGHSVATGDWFVLDQVGLVGRSVSFSLLPSELVSQVVVRKGSTADLVEGGAAGNVDILTRKPLDFTKRLTMEASAGTVYADLPDKWDPQFNGLVNWKNDANTIGVLLQGFFEKRHLRRDGQETLGYAQISPTSALATARPALANVWYPTLIGSSFFEQERERKGGLVDVQVKVSNDLSFDFNAFTSKMEATNYNRNWMFWGSRVIGGDNRIPTSFTVSGNTLVQASFANAGPTATTAVVDNIYRKGAFSETSYYNVDANWRLSDRLRLTGQIGETRGKGETPVQQVFEGDVNNTGAAYTMHGISQPVSVAFPNVNTSVFTGTSLDWIFGASPASTKDTEKYGRVDAEWGLDKGSLNNIKFGGRWAEHTRDTHQVAQGPLFSADPFNAANLPHWNGETYPGDFGSRLGGDWPRQPWMLSQGELDRWGSIYTNRDPVTRQYWPGEFAIKEKNSAAYVMASFDGAGWSGNLGVRFVQTKEEVTVNVAIPGSICDALAPCNVPGAITTSAFGSFYKNLVANTYNDTLPSANLRWDLGNSTIARFGASRTMARPDYSALGGSITADDTTHTGNGGNPNLKPIRSNNYDAAVEWYYAPRALLSAGLFHMSLQDYVAFGTYQIELLDIRQNRFQTYTISAPTNSHGKVDGLELAWQQPIFRVFGVQANYTLASGSEQKHCASTDAACQSATSELVGNSRHTYNLSGYYEDMGFGARLAYTYRSSFFVGLDRSTPQFQDGVGTLSASLSYNGWKNVSLHLDALNLNDPILKMYGADRNQPRAFYANGRQYYFTVRVKI